MHIALKANKAPFKHIIVTTTNHKQSGNKFFKQDLKVTEALIKWYLQNKK